MVLKTKHPSYTYFTAVRRLFQTNSSLVLWTEQLLVLGAPLLV